MKIEDNGDSLIVNFAYMNATRNNARYNNEYFMPNFEKRQHNEEWESRIKYGVPRITH